MSNPNLKQWLISPIKNDFWLQLMEAFEEEFLLFRNEKIKPLEDFFNYKDLTDNNSLFNISNHYGYFPDISIDDSLAYLKRDIESIGFRKKFKTTYFGYEYSYKAINYNGQIFTLFWNGEKLIRADLADNYTNILTLLSYSEPYLWLAEKNYNEFFSGGLNYDPTSISINYDDTSVAYDAIFQKQSTKHIVPEYFIDKVLIKESEDYLMTIEYLRYLENAISYNRRTVEIPHNGCQLTMFMDLTGYYDSMSGLGLDSIPILNLKTSIIPTKYDFDNTIFSKIKIGTGTQTLVGDGDVTPYPTDLANTVFEEIIHIDETNKTLNFYVLQTIIEIKYIQNEEIANSPTTSISTTTIHPFLRKNDLVINYTISAVDYIAMDDGNGNIVGDLITSGTINYDTGQIDITFSSITTGSVTCNYIYNSNVKTNSVDYENIKITEMGLYNALDELVVYATFPPIEYNPNDFHLGFQVVVLKEGMSSSAIPNEVDSALYNQGLYTS